MVEPPALQDFETMVTLLRAHAASQPDKRAFTFLIDGETREQTLTYQQLDQRARAIAAQLQAEGLSEQPVLLLYPPGLDYITSFFGCLYAGAIAVPSYPPHRRRPDPRIEGIISDTQATAALTDHATWSDLEGRVGQRALLAGLRWLTSQQIDQTDLQAAHDWYAPERSRHDPAFLQYTSGATTQPKGVVLTHHNLLVNLAAIGERFNTSPTTCSVFWLPPYHDMGLIGGILGTVASGGSAVLMTPQAFLQKPIRWLAAIARYRATISGGPNFAYDMCINQITPEQRAALDLSSWQVAFNGAEPVRASTLERFAATFAPCGFQRAAFLPCYGLAEATLLVSGNLHATQPMINTFQAAALSQNQAVAVQPDAPDAYKLVSCGAVIAEHDLAIVDPLSSRRCTPGQIGEIWVAGASVASGYWRNEDVTAHVFGAFLPGNGPRPFLRTGDLGFVDDGHLFVTGRSKEVIILRGRNHYPQDLELTAEHSHVALRPGCGAAFALEGEEGERVVIAFEVKRQARHGNLGEIIGAIRSAVACTHQIELAAVVLLKPGNLPRTSSGKIQRQECRARFVQGTLDSIAAMPTTQPTTPSAPTVSSDEVHAELRAKLAEILGVHPDQIDLSEPIHMFGLGSLSAVAIKTHLEDRYGINIPVETFFEDVSFAQLVSDMLVQSSTLVSLPAPISRPSPTPSSGLQFSLSFFPSHETNHPEHAYRFLIEAARFADTHDFSAVWLPERHFHAFGGLYPNPAVLAAVLAQETQHIRLRAGSVVLPLHHPIRVAEEWAMVDVLAQGRVDLSFATGWNANDFVLAPQHFHERHTITLTGIETVQQLWRGEAVQLTNGLGQPTEVRIYPLPHQPELTVWLTCTGGAQRFREAGARGYHVLTALFLQSLDELAEKIALYRAARAQQGYDPTTGHVTLMLHTFVSAEMDEVRRTVERPLRDYLTSSRDLWRQGREVMDGRSEHQAQQTLDDAVERYLQSSALIGTPDSCTAMLERLCAAGVNEIACLIDFGVAAEQVLDGLAMLDALRVASTSAS